MVSILVCYATGEGQTARVADRIADVLADRGHDATVVDVADRTPDLASEVYDAVVVGASIHAGSHQSSIREFAASNRDRLAALPTAFVQVSLSSASEAGRAEAAEYVDDFVTETGWHPDRIGQFGGALRYSEYGFLKRLMMRAIVNRTMDLEDADGTVEASGDVEYTDWDEVEAFAADVAAFVEGRLGVVPPPAEDGAGDG